jgi:hypothetical protein
MAAGDWTGLDQWRAKIMSLPDRLESWAFGMLSDAADSFVGHAQAFCPVDRDTPFRRPPGTLRDSIHKEQDQSGGGGNPVVRVVAGSAEAFYATFVEFGVHVDLSKYHLRDRPQRVSYRTPDPAFPIHLRDFKDDRPNPSDFPSPVSWSDFKLPAQPYYWPSYHLTTAQIAGELQRLKDGGADVWQLELAAADLEGEQFLSPQDAGAID